MFWTVGMNVALQMPKKWDLYCCMNMHLKCKALMAPCNGTHLYAVYSHSVQTETPSP